MRSIVKLQSSSSRGLPFNKFVAIAKQLKPDKFIYTKTANAKRLQAAFSRCAVKRHIGLPFNKFVAIAKQLKPDKFIIPYHFAFYKGLWEFLFAGRNVRHFHASIQQSLRRFKSSQASIFYLYPNYSAASRALIAATASQWKYSVPIRSLKEALSIISETESCTPQNRI